MSEKREKKNQRSALRPARAAGVTVGAALAVLLTSPTAQALNRDDGDDPGSGLSIFETLSLFVVTPILLFAVIAGLVVLAERKRT
jgi:Na+/melibiose symporter-like transporter